MSNLIIGNVEVITDSEGRYNLNALHRASGGNPAHKPSQWLRLKSTEDLVNELKVQIHTLPSEPVKSIHGGDYNGTFAHKLLVVSYAGWISPSFQLRVNQAFLDAQSPKHQIPQTYAEALQLAANQAKQLEEQKPKVEYFDLVSKNETHLNATQVGQKVGLSAFALNKHLEALGVYNRAIKRGRVFSQEFIDKGFGMVKTTSNGFTQAVFTIKGEQEVVRLLTSEGII